MIDAELLIAFALVTGATSLVPGPSMLFVLGQAAWHGARQGASALAGLQIGYVFWWVLAALGLGTLAAAFPMAFHLLAIGGVLYLAWLGAQAWHMGGKFVAMSNPKSLIYIVAILPPFIDAQRPIAPQLLVLALVAMAIDVVLGALYIFAGNGLARAMDRPATRKWIDRAVGAIFVLIALGILAELLRG